MEPKGNKVEDLLPSNTAAAGNHQKSRGSSCCNGSSLPPPDPTTATDVTAPTTVEPTQQPQQQKQATLPAGWSSAISGGGHVYFYEQSSGRTSWNHPNEFLPRTSSSSDAAAAAAVPPPPSPSPPPPQPSSWSRPMRIVRNKNPSNNDATTTSAGLLLNDDRRPHEHACLAIVACIVFIPLGMISLIYSLKVDSAWTKGHTRQSLKYSRRAQIFGQLACTLGAIFWIYWIFFSGPAGAGWVPMELHWPVEWFGA